jgi:hypothetical protein
MLQVQMQLVPQSHYFGEPFSLKELEETPHLKALAKAIRDINHATKALRDIDLENKEEYNDFLEACKDLIFRLKVTNQYYLLSLLFNEPGLRSKWIRFLEKQYEEEQQEQQKKTEQVLQSSKSSTTTNASNIPTGYTDIAALYVLTHPNPALAPIHHVYHYEQEIIRITYEHKIIQANIYANAANVRLNTYNNMVTHITVPQPANAPPQYLIDTNIEDQKRRLIGLKRDFDEALAALNSVGPNNVPVAEKLKTAAKMFYDEIDKAINEIHNKVDKEVQDIVVKDMIDQLYDTDKNIIVNEVNNQIRTTQISYDQTMLEVNSYCENARLLAREDVNSRLESLIFIASNLDIVPEGNTEDSLRAKVLNLNMHKESFFKANEHHVMQRILKECHDDIIEIERIIGNVKSLTKTSIQAFESFKKEAGEFKELIVSSLGISSDNIDQTSVKPSEKINDTNILGKVQEPDEKINGSTSTQPLVDNKKTISENISMQVNIGNLTPPPMPFVSPYNMAAFAPVVEHQPSFNPQVLPNRKDEKGALEILLTQKSIKEAVQDVRENGEKKEKAQLQQPIDISNIEDSLRFITKNIKKLLKTAEPNDVDLMNQSIQNIEQLLGNEPDFGSLNSLHANLNNLLTNENKENYDILSEPKNEITAFINQNSIQNQM